ncbi:unnamed protein product [Allacma fusca]|uniref:Uncharacterized protein n=1 Tax=Allacma fusca TaxID=39272 RepID=A0A8J2KZH0_9HEXA|nr:unnamed protein product [Allacma fusca]
MFGPRKLRREFFLENVTLLLRHLRGSKPQIFFVVDIFVNGYVLYDKTTHAISLISRSSQERIEVFLRTGERKLEHNVVRTFSFNYLSLNTWGY